MTSNVLILGDSHIGKGTSIGKSIIDRNSNTRIVDQFKILEWATNLAEEEHCDNIVLTGDIFEEPKPSLLLITSFIKWLKYCEYKNINVHLIFGNHDFIRIGSEYSSALNIINEADLHNVFVHQSIQSFYVNNCSFTLVPFFDRRIFNTNSNSEALEKLKHLIDLENSSIDVRYTKVLIGHLAIEGSIPVGDEFDDLSNELMCPVDMFSKYNYTWMGHVHSPQVMSTKPYVAHIGSMDISNFGEADQEKIAIIFDTKLKSFKSVKVPTRTLKKIKIDVPEDIDNVDEFLNEEIAKNKNLDSAIVSVEVSIKNKMQLFSRVKLEKEISKYNVHNISKISEVKLFSNIKKKDDVEKISNKLDLKNAIKKYSELFVDEKYREKFIDKATIAASKLKE